MRRRTKICAGELKYVPENKNMFRRADASARGRVKRRAQSNTSLNMLRSARNPASLKSPADGEHPGIPAASLERLINFHSVAIHI
ncbi:hypothetical protein SAMN05216238_10123 [Lentibacillus persicus]|uniref:Uncharacterized protein n=1 Tax=Lentibacillus persicus TaxID=640948 RepID=A0A1I1RZF7_9BACI|nr:hypothetical protein SAMN05216238_10123 [Lentibacillus persicus]